MCVGITITPPQLWILGQSSHYLVFAHDITALCVIAVREGLTPNCSKVDLCNAICELLKEQSLVAMGVRGSVAHGIWRAPSGKLLWWTSAPTGGWWHEIQAAPVELLRTLLKSAPPALVDEIRLLARVAA